MSGIVFSSKQKNEVMFSFSCNIYIDVLHDNVVSGFVDVDSSR